MTELKLTQKDVDELAEKVRIKFLKKRMTLDLKWVLDTKKFKSTAIKFKKLFNIKVAKISFSIQESNPLQHTSEIESIPINAENICWDGYIPINENVRVPIRLAHLGGSINRLSLIIFYDITKKQIPVLDEKDEFIEIHNPYYNQFQPKLKELKKILKKGLGDFEVCNDPNELFKKTEINDEAKWQKKFWDVLKI
jgi:hypothetical protein